MGSEIMNNIYNVGHGNDFLSAIVF